MIGKNKKSGASDAPLSAPNGASNSLVQGTHVEGKINAENDIRIDGSLNGTLICKGKVIIGPKGKVEGDITCQQAVIEGTFMGNLKVNELLNVRESAKITGEIVTDKLLVQAGAIFNVTCSMGGQKVMPLSEKPVAS